jgi:hypothetical protein
LPSFFWASKRKKGAAAHPPLSKFSPCANAHIKIKSSRSDPKPNSDHENTSLKPKTNKLW